MVDQAVFRGVVAALSQRVVPGSMSSASRPGSGRWVRTSFTRVREGRVDYEAVGAVEEVGFPPGAGGGEVGQDRWVPSAWLLEGRRRTARPPRLGGAR